MFELKKLISSFILPPGITVTVSFIFMLYFIKRNTKVFKIFFLFTVTLYLIFSSFVWKIIFCKIENRIKTKVSVDGDVIAVFGADISSFRDIISNAYMPGIYSNSRIFTAYRVYRKTSLPIILSGGSLYGEPAFGEESAKILSSAGVDDRKIYADNLSKDTYENIEKISEICTKNGFKKIIAVSDSIHLLRIGYLLNKKNIDFSLYPSSYFCSDISYIDFLPLNPQYSYIFFHELAGIMWYSIVN